jgi:hypothetical protein
MAEGKLTVGNVDILALTDGEGDFPFPLSQLFPSVPAEAWTPFRQRYPELFWRPRHLAQSLRLLPSAFAGAHYPGRYWHRQ